MKESEERRVKKGRHGSAVVHLESSEAASNEHKRKPAGIR